MFTADATFETSWGARTAGHAPGAALRLLEHRTSEGRAAWEAAWHRAGQGEVFAHPDYCADRALPGERALCAAMEFPDGAQIIYPFLLRPINHDVAGEQVAEGLWDIYTPLAYGGPLGRDVSEAQVEEFWHAMRAWARHHGVVSEIIRFTPVARHRLPYPETLRRQAPHVVIDLSGGEEDILARMRKSARRLYRKALVTGISVRIENSEAGIDEFLAIHDETMVRAGAHGCFRLRQEDLRALHRAAPERVLYVFACQDGRPISVELALMCEDSSHAYLGAPSPKRCAPVPRPSSPSPLPWRPSARAVGSTCSAAASPTRSTTHCSSSSGGSPARGTATTSPASRSSSRTSTNASALLPGLRRSRVPSSRSTAPARGHLP